MWRRLQKFFGHAIPALLFALYAGLLVCLLNQWDSIVAATLIPFWAWAGGAMAVSAISWILFRGTSLVLVFSLWLGTTIVISEESIGIGRDLLRAVDPPTRPPEDELIRVITLDAGGSVDTLSGVSSLEPDIVLVQDSPVEGDVARVAELLFGMNGTYHVANGQAILARGEFLATLDAEVGRAAHVRLRLADGFLIDLTGLQLESCLPRYDLWNPAAWSTLTLRRIENRRQLRTHLGENQIVRSDTARLVAGGFATPPRDDVFRPLESNGMRDAFSLAGVGWGNTFPLDYARLRLDQIWVSKNLQPFRVEAKILPGAPRRIVIADLRIIRSEDP